MPENDFYNNNIVFRSIARLDLMKIVQVYVYFCLISRGKYVLLYSVYKGVMGQECFIFVL